MDHGSWIIVYSSWTFCELRTRNQEPENLSRYDLSWRDFFFVVSFRKEADTLPIVIC